MIDPIAFHLGPLAVHWYGIAYLVGLATSIFIAIQLNKKRHVFKNKEQIYDLAFWAFLFGVILGGRLGYVLFYNFSYYFTHPAKILVIWEGGMSFHGGLLGMLIVGYFYCKKHKIRFLDAADLSAAPASFALVFGRLANFVNQELVGRVIQNPRWQGLGFDFGDGMLRYPSQLFAAGKDLLLFLILLFIFHQKPRRGVLLSSFLIGYGMLRFIVEFFRAPDPQIGFIFQIFTLGQIFSLGMILFGGFLWLKTCSKRPI